MTRPGPSSPLGAIVKHGKGRRHRRRDTKQLRVDLLTSWSDLEKIRDEWNELYESAHARNPYASTAWSLWWARHFVDEQDLAVVTVRREGELIGIAPWYRLRVAGLAHGLQLIGTGRHDWLTELPQVLVATGEHRSVLRAAVGFWCDRVEEWDWIDLPMLAEQGWFEPDWLTGSASGGIIQHKGARAAVILTLPDHPDQLTAVFKRNLVESTHRGRNRLNKSGVNWKITTHSEAEDVAVALPVLAALHAQRAKTAGRRCHPDELGNPRRLAFLHDVLTEMAQIGRAELLTLDIDDEPVAAQLVLRAPCATYLAMSGVDPRWWHVSPVTLLQMRAAEEAAGRGHLDFNLSVGPSVAKLRWSERVEQHPQFIVSGPRRRSKGIFAVHRFAALAVNLHRDARRHRITGKDASKNADRKNPPR